MSAKEKIQLFRIIQIDKAIRECKYPNAVTLSEQLEYSVRTIKRDIDYLRDYLDAPVAYDHQKKGYFYESKDYFLPSIHMSEDDFFGLIVSSRVLKQYKNTPLYDSLQSVFNKLTKYLPETITVDPLILDNSFTYIEESNTPLDSEIWKKVFAAIQQKQSLQIEYHALSKGETSRRVVDGYHVICYKNSWYLIAYCHKAEALRMYSISRIKKCKILNKGYIIDSNFSIDDVIGDGFGIFSKTDKYEIDLNFNKKIAPYIKEKIWHKSQKIKELPDGSINLSLTVQHLLEIKKWVLSWGSNVKVNSPKELINLVSDEIKKMNKMY